MGISGELNSDDKGNIMGFNGSDVEPIDFDSSVESIHEDSFIFRDSVFFQ